jgi:hypothetical protein
MALVRVLVASLGLAGLASSAILPKINSYPGHELALENRTLDEIYAAAKNETGELIVLWGGDGKCSFGLLTIFPGGCDLY